jgi:hypothetical protein
MYTSDIEDAYQVALVMSGIEEDSAEQKFRKRWEVAVRAAEQTTIHYSEIENIRRTDYGRDVAVEYLNNPIILGRTKTKILVALDGSHRLFAHQVQKSQNVSVIIIDISWIEDADDMDYDLP